MDGPLYCGCLVGTIDHQVFVSIRRSVDWVQGSDQSKPDVLQDPKRQWYRFVKMKMMVAIPEEVWL